MKHLLIAILLLCLWIPSLHSQPVYGDTDSISAIMDSMENDEVADDDSFDETATEVEFNKPTLRIVSADSLEKLKRQKDFAYMGYIDSALKNRIEPEMPEPEKEEPASPGIFDVAGIRMLYWSIALLAVLALLWRLFLGNTAVFSKNRAIKPQETEQTDEPVSGQHLNQLLEAAVRAGDYRQAVRLLYLQTLAILGEKQLLHLSPQKTNYQYQQELHGHTLQPAFSKLTLHYEYAWFGGLRLTREQFSQIKQSHENFREKL